MGWQKTFMLSKKAKGCYLVTDEILNQIRPGLQDVQIGMLFLFIQHTSAALTINENFDKDVRKDMDMALDKIVPENLNWLHTDEGPDDSVSHTKATLVGTSISVPITEGELNLGTWQGIYLTEFRHVAHSRRVVATILS
jgi:secondary thiamine-phosphate synthase enzyme